MSTKIHWPDTTDAITIKEVAVYFKVSTRTIREWVEKDDSFPRPFKKFGTLRFRHAEIERYWERNIKNLKNNLRPKKIHR